jgi:hypothetical protein
MSIKVKERSKTDLFIRCNTEQEKQYIMMMFLELKSQPRMENQVFVRTLNGKELYLKKKEPPVVEEPKPFIDGVTT